MTVILTQRYNMASPISRIRQTLFAIHPLSYRIKTVTPDKEFMNKKLFIEVINQLKQIEERRDFMAEEIGMDMTAYEDQFFAVIENLMRMHFTKEQVALIQTYIYQLIPDKEWDGTITIKRNKKEEVLNFKTPEEVWNVVNTFN